MLVTQIVLLAWVTFDVEQGPGTPFTPGSIRVRQFPRPLSDCAPIKHLPDMDRTRKVFVVSQSTDHIAPFKSPIFKALD